MKLLRIFLFFLVALLFTAQSGMSDSKKWELDAAHSNIYFSVDHIFSKVRGHFNEFSADVVFDPKDLEGSSFTFELAVDSIDTGIAKRDKHLLSADFFNVDKFGKIIFESTTIIQKSPNTYTVNGALTIKGRQFDLALPLILAGVKDHPRAKGKRVAGFNGTLVIDRLVYNVGSGKFFEYGLVGKDVEVFVTIEVIK